MTMALPPARPLMGHKVGGWLIMPLAIEAARPGPRAVDPLRDVPAAAGLRGLRRCCCVLHYCWRALGGICWIRVAYCRKRLSTTEHSGGRCRRNSVHGRSRKRSRQWSRSAVYVPVGTDGSRPWCRPRAAVVGSGGCDRRGNVGSACSVQTVAFETEASNER
jgi:hypothetical protein